MNKRNGMWFVFLMGALVAFSPATLAQDDPWAPGSVYFWQFNEGEGNSVTDEDWGFTASLGLPYTDEDIPQSTSDSPSGQSGDLAVEVNDGLFADDSENAVLDITEGPITMEAWIKLGALNNVNGIMAYGSSYKMGINNGFLLFTFYGIVDIASEIPMDADNVWHHVACAWEPEVGVTFYLDGEEADFVENADAPRDVLNNRLDIGSETNGAAPLPGFIDRARIHNALLTEADLDSDPANPKDPLDSTIAAYSFDEGEIPYENQADENLPALSTAIERSEQTQPEFSEDAPTGEDDDYSIYFDGTDQVIFEDELDNMQFIDESFTFEAWLKFDAAEQVSDRPVLIAYGIGGQNGYSFSFRARQAAKAVEDSPSGQAGDYSNRGVLLVDDSIEDDINFDSPLNLIDGPITMEAWVKLDSLSGWTDIARYDSTYKFGFHENGNLLFTMLAVEDVDSGVPAPVDQEWHHMASVWDPGVGVTFYLDGEEASFIETENTNQDLQGNGLSIGGTLTGGSAIDGVLDRVRIHNAVLSADQLDSDPNNPREPLNDTVVSYNFEEASLPYSNDASPDLPADTLFTGSPLTVTTFGIIDAHSDDAIIPDDNQWHHVAAVHDMGVEFRYYIDGELRDSMDYDGGVRFAEVFNYHIGSEEGGGHAYVGLLDRVKITRDALTEGDLDWFEPVFISNWELY